MDLNFKYYPTSGDSEGGICFLVVHGWKADLNHIEPLSKLLSSIGDVYAIDLPGHGKTPIPMDVWEMKNFADTVNEFILKHELKKVVYVGHSFGGKTGIKLSALHPKSIEKLVLIGASGIRPKACVKKRIRNFILKLLRNLIRFKNTGLGKRIYENWYIPKFASRDYLSAGPMLKTFIKTVNEELHQDLRKITTPTLLIWGEEDAESPKEVGEMMKALINNSKLIILPGQGHYPYLGSSVGLLGRYIKDFVSK